MSLKRRIADWLEHRTGLESAVKSFLYEDIPASSGWHQVFGSVAVWQCFCFWFKRSPECC